MSLLNRKAVKSYLLARAEQRAHKLTRVSGETLVWLESQLMTSCDRLIHAQPSVGKTIYPPIRESHK